MEVLIVDDHRQVRAVLTRFLDRQEDIDVVGEASDGVLALAQIEALEPDVVLLDVNMPGMSGLQVLEALPDEAASHVIMVSMYIDPFLVEQALRAGAAGYVSKRSVATDLAPAVRAVASGGSYLGRLAAKA